MKQHNKKLIASAFLVVIAITLMVTVSYAWFTLAGSPSLAGVQINIGGRNTIKIAPDITKEAEDGTVIHYPGYFNDSFSVSDYDSYDYLEDFTGLAPVSTADGIHWFMPENATSMEIKGDYSLDDYIMDETLTYANMQKSNVTVENDESGSYAYLDFWVVAPMDCNLRVSIGSESEGSYVVGLPEVVKDQEGYSLDDSASLAAASARVGFLVNTRDIEDNAPITAYSASKSYISDYTKLRGVYQEAGDEVVDESSYQFTIYEPNGTMHSDVGLSTVQSESGITYVMCEDGDYAVTNPIGLDENGNRVLKDISDILAVQRTNSWKMADSSTTLLTANFQSSMLKEDLTSMSEDEIMESFYTDVLHNNFSGYVNRAKFFENTKLLYLAGDGTVTSKTSMSTLDTANAVDDAVIVSLEKNVPQRIRMYVWLEGQDVDCVREAALEYFAVGIELAGSTQD